LYDLNAHLKSAADAKERDKLLSALRSDYGSDVKIETRSFEHTGIKHEQRQDGSVYTHQNHYVLEISEIDTTKLDMTNPETDLDEATMTVFWSLLGALSWLQQTRADIAPFIGYLQRIAKKPNNGHIRMANKVLRYCRRVKTGLHFKKLMSPVRMVIVADSAYQANNDLTECLALQGYLIMIVGGQPSRSKFPGGHGYVLEWVSKKFNTITRSSFYAELRNQLEAAQSGIHFSTSWKRTRRHSHRQLLSQPHKTTITLLCLPSW